MFKKTYTKCAHAEERKKKRNLALVITVLLQY